MSNRNRSRSPLKVIQDWTVQKIFDGQSAIISIKDKFCFEGALEFRVLQGQVSVLGRNIGSLNDWSFVVSDPSRNQMITQIQSDGDSEVEIRPCCYTILDRCLMLKSDVVLGDFPNVNTAVHESNIFRTDPSWNESLKKLSICDNFIIVGASNSGKSTYCNYLLNQLANQGISEVFYLEADCGQPNFDILPGQLCLVKLHTNIVTKVTKIVKSYYFNSSNPASDPEQYLEQFKLLQQIKIDGKLVVNTNGWVEGLGSFILNQMLMMFDRATTNVIKLSSSKNFDLDLQDFWHTTVQGDLSNQNSFQKGLTTRNRKIWDYVCGRPQWCVTKPTNLIKPVFVKYQDNKRLNLQVVACLLTSEVQFFGFVTNVQQDGFWISTQAEIKQFDKVVACDAKLFCVPSNLLMRQESQEEYLCALMRNHVTGRSTQEIYLMAELL